VNVVLTLVVRDEEEILAANLDYHLRAGVSLALVTDHRSQDRTLEILDVYRRQGVVRVLREEGEHVAQSDWQTRMARLAFTDHAADWVLLGDADEFWWPLGASTLPAALERVPDRYGSVLALQRNFVPLRMAQGATFAERMVVSLAADAPINDPATPFRPVAKVAVRGAADVRVGEGGGHRVFGAPGESLEAWRPAEILHFPLRSREQCARKYRKTWTGWQANLRADLERARKAADADDADIMWERLALDDETLRRGIAGGSLAVDTRLRDALRLASDTRRARPPEPSSSRPMMERLLAAVYSEAEVVRRRRWLDDLDRRLRGIEDRFAPKHRVERS
jgi:hypothetical protein